MKLPYYIKRFWDLVWIEKLLLIKSLSLLAFINLLVNLIPIKYYLNLLKMKPKKLVFENNKPYAIKIAYKSLRRVTLILPWQNNCLVKSITLKLLLNSLGVNSKIAIGITKSQYSVLNAHAFIKIDNYSNYFDIKGIKEFFTIT
jgi:hypothetical protein